jgi:hypothetical protein
MPEERDSPSTKQLRKAKRILCGIVRIRHLPYQQFVAILVIYIGLDCDDCGRCPFQIKPLAELTGT